ncbi:MAG: 3-isopropylmalate dehydratase small subunit [Citromicrobium sp.]|nr:3-isopropylmalate dehydratase small subunit [Citromicrobium sp.]
MQLEPFTRLISRTLVLPQHNIDTDQIIPARFLTTTSREGLGAQAFYDWRYTGDDQPKNDTPLPAAGAGDRQVLVAGPNFGCGSSREHAPWALLDYGFRAVVSSDIADIFKSNALKNGLLPVEVDERTHAALLERPGMRMVIDLESCTLETEDDIRAQFSVEPFARRCLLDGVDPLGHILAHEADIAAYEVAAA